MFAYMYVYMTRFTAEQRLLEVMSNMDKAAIAHSEQVTSLQDSLATQKQLASKYNDKVCGNGTPTLHIIIIYSYYLV